MTVLAIETATIEVAAALVDDGGVRAEFRARGGGHHVETLHPAIVGLLEEAGCALTDLEAVAVDVGPGLFTGLRVGIAAAKGFALGLGIGAVGIRSTEILAAAGLGHGAGAVVPVVDMRRGELAWSLPGSSELHLGELAVLVHELESLPGELLIVGDGAARFGAELREALGGRAGLGGPELAAPPVATLGAIARARLSAGEATSAIDLVPVYLRDADARANFATRPEVVPR